MKVLQSLIDILRYRGLEYLGRFYGVYRGKVVDNNDPLKMGRIKVIVDIISPKPLEAWAIPIGFWAGRGHGEFYVPEKDEIVYVMFERGDPCYPLYIGGHYFKENIPEDMKSNYPKVRGIVTKKGNKIIINDETGEITIHANSTIYLIEDADEPLVLGNKWKNLFMQHKHPTGVGPSGPPDNAPQAEQCLSQKVKTK